MLSNALFSHVSDRLHDAVSRLDGGVEEEDRL